MKIGRLCFSICAILLHPTVYSAADTVINFGTIAETWDAEISPGGSHLALGCSPHGERAICIYDLVGDSKPKLIPAPDNVRLTGLYWASDQYLLYSVNLFETLKTSSGLKDVRVDRLLSYNIDTGKTAVLMKNARGSTNTTQVESMLVDDNGKVLMAFSFYFGDHEVTGSRTGNRKGETVFIAYEVSLKTGKAKVLDRSQRSINGAVFDERGNRLANVIRDYAKHKFAIESLTDGRRIVFEDNEAELSPFYIQGISDTRDAIIVDFDDGDRDGLYTLSLVDGAIAPYTINDQPLGDVGVLKDRHRATIVGYYHTDDSRIAIYTDPALKEIQSDVKAALGTENIWLTSWTADRSEFTILAKKPGRPTQYYSYQPNVPALSMLGGVAPWLDDATLGDVRKITYAAQDGLNIPAYLTLPAGASDSDGPFPLVLLPHGGPEARDTIDYDWMAQALAQDGYLVLQPNFRGSAGYGAEFRNAGFNEFGDLMVQDVLDGATYLQEQGLASLAGACAMGASYGGYSALMTALRDDETVKCVISINGVTDPFSIAATSESFLPGSTYWEQYMGSRYSTGRRAKREITPLQRTGDYRVPVLLIHGEEDTTVPYEQSANFASKSARKSSITLVKLEGADHYLGSTSDRTKLLSESLIFLQEHHPAK